MRSLRALGIAAALALAAVSMLSSCVTEAAYSGNAGGTKVAIIGDIRAFAARDALHAAFDPDYSVVLSAWADQTIAQSQAVADQYVALDPDIVVLALGTEDVWDSNVPLATMKTELISMKAKFPAGTCFVVPTLTTVSASPTYTNTRAAAFNNWLGTQSGFVVDWDGTTNWDPPQFLAEPDLVQPNPDLGSTVFASVVGEGVSQCDGGTGG